MTVECVQSPAAFFAKCLYRAMKGMGTNDRTLIRIIVSRSEIDLNDIKREFERIYDRTLLSAVKVSLGMDSFNQNCRVFMIIIVCLSQFQSETSGDYKRALCAIIGGA